MSSATNPQPAPPLDLAHTKGAGAAVVAWAESRCECEPPDEEIGESGTIICARCAIRAVLDDTQRVANRLRSMLLEVAARDRKNVPCYCDAFAIGRVTHTDRCSEIARAALSGGQGGA